MILASIFYILTNQFADIPKDMHEYSTALLTTSETFAPIGTERLWTWEKFTKTFREESVFWSGYPIRCIDSVRFEHIRPIQSQNPFAEQFFEKLSLELPNVDAQTPDSWGIGFRQYDSSGLTIRPKKPVIWLHERIVKYNLTAELLHYQNIDH